MTPPKVVVIPFIIGDMYHVEGECPTCGFESIVRIEAHTLSDAGVTTIASRTACGRCHADKRRAEG